MFLCGFDEIDLWSIRIMDSILISGTPMVKFKDFKTIKSIQKGNIWFNPLTLYREEEEDKKDTIIGDRFEAMWPIKDATIFIPEKE